MINKLLFNSRLAYVFLSVLAILFGSIDSFGTPIKVTENGNSYNIAWKEGPSHNPTTINIYITPGVLSDDDVSAFTQGINIWDQFLPGINVNVTVGKPPKDTDNLVIVSFDKNLLENTGKWGEALPSYWTPDPLPPSGSTLEITDGQIILDSDAAGNSSLLQNLGSHEFGHILGLDDEERSGGIMDPYFTENSPVRSMNNKDRAEIDILYAVVPEPSTLLLLCFGLAGLASLGRKVVKLKNSAVH